MFSPGAGQMMIVGMIALLLFGKRLPEVARSLGKALTEFKKGVSNIQDDVDRASTSSSSYANTSSNSNGGTRPAPIEERADPIAPKFEPPVSAPTSASNASSGGSDRPA